LVSLKKAFSRQRSAVSPKRVTSYELRVPSLMISQKVWSRVIARSVATKQSHEVKEIEDIRLLRFARNDSFLTFLRNHQVWDSAIQIFRVAYFVFSPGALRFLESVFHFAVRIDFPPRPARRPALGVDRHRILGNVGVRPFDVNRQGGHGATETHGADA